MLKLKPKTLMLKLNFNVKTLVKLYFLHEKFKSKKKKLALISFYYLSREK